MISAPATLSLYTNYLAAVREAIKQKPSEWTFKSDPRYREVLEHTPVEFAEIMLKWSLAQMPNLSIDYVRLLCRQNDSIGTPVQVPIADLGTYSTGNMRYLCHAIKVWQHIDSLDVDQIDVVEIGGGYGGLAFYMKGFSRYFKTGINPYLMFDLPDVVELQQRVLDALDVNAHAFDGIGSTYPWVQMGHPVFCISMYAFSEFDQATRDWYAERVLKHCRHGLMVWNFPQAQEDADGRWFGGPPYQFVEWPMLTIPAQPALYDGHLEVMW
jgi:hypothetical protein